MARHVRSSVHDSSLGLCPRVPPPPPPRPVAPIPSLCFSRRLWRPSQAPWTLTWLSSGLYARYPLMLVFRLLFFLGRGGGGRGVLWSLPTRLHCQLWDARCEAIGCELRCMV